VLTEQSWLKTGLPPTAVNLLAPNSLEVNPLDYHVWRIIPERYKTFHPKPKNNDGQKKVQDQRPQDSINKAILSFNQDMKLV